MLSVKQGGTKYHFWVFATTRPGNESWSPCVCHNCPTTVTNLYIYIIFIFIYLFYDTDRYEKKPKMLQFLNKKNIAQIDIWEKQIQ